MWLGDLCIPLWICLQDGLGDLEKYQSNRAEAVTSSIFFHNTTTRAVLGKLANHVCNQGDRPRGRRRGQHWHVGALAVVRSQASAEKLYHNAGTREGGVYSARLRVLRACFFLANSWGSTVTVGGVYSVTPLAEISTQELRTSMTQNF